MEKEIEIKLASDYSIDMVQINLGGKFVRGFIFNDGAVPAEVLEYLRKLCSIGFDVTIGL